MSESDEENGFISDPITALPYSERVRRQLREAYLDVQSARDANAWSALANLQRQASDLSRTLSEIEQAENDAVDPYADLSVEDRVEATIQELVRWPHQYLEQVLAAVADALGPAAVSAVLRRPRE